MNICFERVACSNSVPSAMSLIFLGFSTCRFFSNDEIKIDVRVRYINIYETRGQGMRVKNSGAFIESRFVSYRIADYRRQFLRKIYLKSCKESRGIVKRKEKKEKGEKEEGFSSSFLCRSARGCDHFRNTYVRTRTSNQLCDSLCTESDEHR